MFFISKRRLDQYIEEQMGYRFKVDVDEYIDKKMCRITRKEIRTVITELFRKDEFVGDSYAERENISGTILNAVFRKLPKAVSEEVDGGLDKRINSKIFIDRVVESINSVQLNNK